MVEEVSLVTHELQTLQTHHNMMLNQHMREQADFTSTMRALTESTLGILGAAYGCEVSGELMNWSLNITLHLIPRAPC